MKIYKLNTIQTETLLHCFIVNIVKRYSNATMKPCNNSSRRRGFTLIELLVVVAVMTLIISLLFPNFMGIRQRARDGQRKADLLQIRNAMELYKMDQSPPVYPTTGAFGSSMCDQCWSEGANCSGNIYMRKLPCDPGSTAPTPYIYTADLSDTLKYSLSACLENAVDEDRDPTPIPDCSSTAVSYTLHEP